MVVRRVGVLSLGKVLGVLYSLLGFIVGALFAIVSLLGAAVSATNPRLPTPSPGFCSASGL